MIRCGVFVGHKNVEMGWNGKTKHFFYGFEFFNDKQTSWIENNQFNLGNNLEAKQLFKKRYIG